jgi:hypothetical protein
MAGAAVVQACVPAAVVGLKMSEAHSLRFNKAKIELAKRGCNQSDGVGHTTTTGRHISSLDAYPFRRTRDRGAPIHQCSMNQTGGRRLRDFGVAETEQFEHGVGHLRKRMADRG